MRLAAQVPATTLRSRGSAPATTSSSGTVSNIREAATPRVRLREASAGSCLELMLYASSTSSPVLTLLKPVIVLAVKLTLSRHQERILFMAQCLSSCVTAHLMPETFLIRTRFHHSSEISSVVRLAVQSVKIGLS